jgi:argininosuccinate synthase
LNKTVVLAFSGGARSTAAVSWLAKHHQADVVAVTLNLGQSGDMAELRDHALNAGAIRAHVLDKREEFARELVLPSLKAGALSDTRYPMATALSSPLIATARTVKNQICQPPASLRKLNAAPVL